MKISIYNLDKLEELRSSLKIDPHQIKTVYNQYFKKAETLSAIEQNNSDNPALSSLIDSLNWQTLELKQTASSEHDGATKLLFQTTDNNYIEAVILRIKTGRTTLCISSQIGCAMNCQFCATGHMGFTRNLTQQEILDQVTIANQSLKKEKRQIKNIVFMGMGEPLNNPVEVYKAIDTMTNPKYFNISIQHICISTVGITPEIKKLMKKFPKIKLAISLHSAREKIRNTIVPISKTYNLNALQATLLEITKNYDTDKNYIFLEYLMIDGITDTDADIEALKNWCNPLPIHLNIIKYNPPQDKQKLKPSSVKQIEYFIDQLKPHIANITTRYSLGSDITAACGQLASKITRI